jgi:hypothetical protein
MVVQDDANLRLLKSEEPIPEMYREAMVSMMEAYEVSQADALIDAVLHDMGSRLRINSQ